MEKKSIQNAPAGRNSRMDYRLLTTILFLSIIIPSQLLAQSFKVSGVVKDAKGQPLQGVSVLVKGTKIGSTTNQQGLYSIGAPSGKSTLVFTNIGYTSWEEDIGGRNEIAITLTDKSSDMEDAIVIGYGGTSRKRDLT